MLDVVRQKLSMERDVGCGAGAAGGASFAPDEAALADLVLLLDDNITTLGDTTDYDSLQVSARAGRGGAARGGAVQVRSCCRSRCRCSTWYRGTRWSGAARARRSAGAARTGRTARRAPTEGNYPEPGVRRAFRSVP